MIPKDTDTVVEQAVYPVPDFTVKDLLSVIPQHCFNRSAFKSSLYILMDVVVIGGVYKTATLADAYVNSGALDFPHPALFTLARVAIWSLYTFIAGLFATGLWVVAHECGHQAFSDSKFVNNSVGWVLHSALGVPYHSWRITHAKHHAATGHMTLDQVFVPKTRTQQGLKPFDPEREELLGSRISEEVRKELWEALGDSPLGATFGPAMYLLFGWPSYLIRNASGQAHYPKGTNHFNPEAVMFSPKQFLQIVLSDLGIVFWFAGIAAWIYYRGIADFLVVYFVPYLWVNHWLVAITFLQHTDPLLPHYRAPEFTFPRGALATFDRNMLGNLGTIMGWLGAVSTHGIAETHILHHVASRIPHYHAWEASAALKKKLKENGLQCEGNPVSWPEMYRVFKECKFVEDEGDVLFFKNAHGLAQMRPAFSSESPSDSGIEINDK